MCAEPEGKTILIVEPSPVARRFFIACIRSAGLVGPVAVSTGLFDIPVKPDQLGLVVCADEVVGGNAADLSRSLTRRDYTGLVGVFYTPPLPTNLQRTLWSCEGVELFDKRVLLGEFPETLRACPALKKQGTQERRVPLTSGHYRGDGKLVLSRHRDATG